MNNLLLKRIFWMLCLMVFPALALADATTTTTALSFTPPATDYSVSFLENLFGHVDGVLYGTGSQIMGAMFLPFNAAVLALGSISVLSIVIVGTMNTAHEGKMMGQKWNSIWVPVRAVTGITLLIPKASGYCLMQIFVMWVIVQGVGAADIVWNAALDYLNRGGVIIQQNASSTTVSSADNGNVAKGAAVMLSGQVCMIGLQKLLEDQRTANKDSGACDGNPNDQIKLLCEDAIPDFIDTVDAVDYQTANQDAGGPYTLTMPNFDSTDPYYSLNGICGSITWNDIELSSTSGDDSYDIESITTLSTADIDAIKAMRAAAVQQMYLDLSTTAQDMVDNDPQINTDNTSTNKAYAWAEYVFGIPTLSTGSACTKYSSDCTLWEGETISSSTFAALFDGTEFYNALETYQAVMASTVKLISDAKDAENASNARKFIATTKANGWMTAGSYFFDLVNLNGSANASTDTDTGTGLEGSSYDINLLTSGFSETGCSATATGSPLFLCQLFGNDSTGPKNLATLVADGIINFPSTTPDLVKQSKPASGGAASSAYGFITNSLLLVQPDEPDVTTSSFSFNFAYEDPSSIFILPSMDFDCGRVPVLKCLGKAISKALYNGMIKPLFNWFLETITDVATKVMTYVVSYPLQTMSDTFNDTVKLIQDPGTNPIVGLASMGVAYINAAGTLWAQMLALVFVTFPISFMVMPIIAMAAPVVLSWMGVMAALGFVTAYWLPFYPFLIFIFAVMAWYALVVQAMVAAPIVALGMSHPDGEGALGKAQPAMMLLTGIFLRPGLMIIGYIAAIATCYIFTWILNTGFSHVLSYIHDGDMYTNWASLFSEFFGILIYTGAYMTVAQKAFNLITTLPDMVLTWIGAQAGSTTQEVSQWAEEGKQKVSEAGKSTADTLPKMGEQAQAMGSKVADTGRKAKKKLFGGSTNIT